MITRYLALFTTGLAGNSGYNGGRWRAFAASGITTQLTNAEDVVAAASSLTDTGIRFVCLRIGT